MECFFHLQFVKSGDFGIEGQFAESFAAIVSKLVEITSFRFGKQLVVAKPWVSKWGGVQGEGTGGGKPPPVPPPAGGPGAVPPENFQITDAHR
jgi:hypothetical protein